MSTSPNATADWYTRFAEVEARGQSAIYETWARGVAADAELIALIETLPHLRRQPNLVFAVSRLLGAPEGAYEPWRRWAVEHWERVRREALERLTQTNEPRRCAALLVALARIEGPIALLEVGASAGLCLYPDRYSYRYGDGEVLHPKSGPSTVLLECDVTGAGAPPAALPDIVWRAGIDLDPIDLANAAASHWLETLVWPEQHERRDRLRAAMDIVRADPPRLVRGDVTGALADLARHAPADATLVVVSSGVLVYVPGLERQRFVDTVTALDARWVSLEGAAVLEGVAGELTRLTNAPSAGRFVLALDGVPLAFVGPHGQSVEWFGAGQGAAGQGAASQGAASQDAAGQDAGA